MHVLSSHKKSKEGGSHNKVFNHRFPKSKPKPASRGMCVGSLSFPASSLKRLP
jgi:hypothetical protein